MPELPILRRLFDYVAALHEKWEYYRALFGHGAERIAVMNRRAGHLFWHLHWAMHDRVILAIARLLDGRGSAKAPNLSLANAITEIDADDSQKTELRARLEGFRNRYASLLSQRHKRIAHTDRAVALDEQEIEGASRAEIQSAIDYIDSLYAAICLAHDGSGAHFERFHRQEAEYEAGVLKAILDRGNTRLDAERRERRERFIAITGARDLRQDFDPGEECLARLERQRQ